VKRFLKITAGSVALLLFVIALAWFGILTSKNSREVGGAIREMISLVQPDDAASRPVVTGGLRIIEGKGIPDDLVGRRVQVAFQSPDRVRVSAEVDGEDYAIGRIGQRVWMHVPHKNLAIEGRNEVPRFSSDPSSVLPITLAPLELPVKGWQLALLPALIKVGMIDTDTFSCRPSFWMVERLGVPKFVLDLKFDERQLPTEVTFIQNEVKVTLAIDDLAIAESSEVAWDLDLEDGQTAELVSLSHLDRFVTVALDNLDSEIEPLPPLSGEHSLLASHGKGRLESVEGTKVLYLEGTPEEMGEQHGVLMKDEVKNLVDRMVYGVGIGSSFDKGRWFFGEIEEAQSRLEPFIEDRYLREMDALADAAGLHRQETRLANFFPELFHCTGFALHGSATAGGRIFHGRVLDYLRGLGLEQNAVVMVVQPDEGNAWVNVGYAGFVGSVTAMNEKHVAIGEMGGRGEGDWDGKPMAQLMREVMEKANTIEEAVAIFEEGPRTCEYYYVISDAKSMKSVGIKSTPDIFETVWSGESHPQLPEAIEDTVLMSANDRYTELVKRVKAGFGEFDAESARDLMTRPVCMTSNIQSVLFAPDTLDFWVANADSENVASATRYTKYNLRELLDGNGGKTKLTSAGAK